MHRHYSDVCPAQCLRLTRILREDSVTRSTRRIVISSTLSAEEFVAFQVHEPRDDSIKNLAILGAGIAAFLGGIALDVAFARDGKDDALEWVPSLDARTRKGRFDYRLRAFCS